jgi:hypothetical protein
MTFIVLASRRQRRRQPERKLHAIASLFFSSLAQRSRDGPRLCCVAFAPNIAPNR